MRAILLAAALMVAPLPAMAQCTPQEMAMKTQELGVAMQAIGGNPQAMAVVQERLAPMVGEYQAVLMDVQKDPSNPEVTQKMCELLDKQLNIVKGQ